MSPLEFLDVLGRATWQPLWVPVLAWTVLALPIWGVLRRFDGLHPYTEYRLSQVLLAILPVGIVASGLFEILPASVPSQGVLPSGSAIALSPVETTEVTTPTTLHWQWMHAAGFVTILALIAGLIRLGRFTLDAAAAVRVRGTLDERTDPSLQRKVARLAENVGIGRPVRVAVTPDTMVPVTLGGLQPTILVPPGLTDRPDSLRTTLIHECIHIRRWDDLAHFVERFLAALFAIHPFVDQLRQQIEGARERACDAVVLGRCSKSVISARSLFDESGFLAI